MATEEKDSAGWTEKFPDSFKAALELQRRLNDANTGSVEQREARKPHLEALKQHIFRLQQGLPVVHLSGDDGAEVYQQRRAGLQRTKLELLSREQVAVKELLEAYDALAKANEELLGQVANLQKTIGDLQSIPADAGGVPPAPVDANPENAPAARKKKLTQPS